MMKSSTIFKNCVLMLLSLVAFQGTAQTAYEYTTIGSTVVVDFNSFTGAGFSSTPTAGMLHSENWAATGFSDGALTFGGTQTTGDYAGGPTTGGVTSAAIYAYDRGSGNNALWIQPTGSEFSPGDLTFRIQNLTGQTLDTIIISFEQIYFNDAPRGNSFNFSVSMDGTNFMPVPELSDTTIEVADNQVYDTVYTLVLTGTMVPPNAYLYGRWESDDVLGGGARDEIGLDNLTFYASAMGGGGSNPQPCSEPFFSEYIEGSGSNKAVEIFNPTSSSINLSDYSVYYYVNGATTPTQIDTLDGTLAPGDVYVYAADAANAAILAQADDTLFYPSVVHYNGDDAFALVKNHTDTVDIFGVIGVDPGSNWPVGSGSTANNTLVRKASVQNGQLDWTLGATEWDVYPQNFSDSLGTHTMTPCGVVTNPEFNFSSAFATVNEGAGTVDVTVTVSQPANCAVDVNLSTVSTATSGSDFTFSSPQTLVFTVAGPTSQTITIPITDDAAVEGDETIILNLQDTVGGCNIGGLDMMTITIEDNDYNAYTIGQVTTEDTQGLADSLGVNVQVAGIVTTLDMGFNGLNFGLQDATAGTIIFTASNNQTFGYTPTIGDSIIVQGVVDQFNGLTEIIPDTIIFVSAGNTLPTIQTVTTLDESVESELVMLECVWMVNPTDWTTGSGSSGFNVDFTNGNDTFQIRIDRDLADLYNANPPADSLMNITGIVGQYDNSAPHDAGYQLLPRMLDDIDSVPAPQASFTQTSTLATVDFSAANVDCGGDYIWDFGDGAVGSGQTASHTYAATGTYNVCLTVTNRSGSTTDCQNVIVSTGINDLEASAAVTVFPVPTNESVTVSAEGIIERVEVTNITGQLVDVIEVQEESILIPVMDWANGIYILKIETDKGIALKKIIKE